MELWLVNLEGIVCDVMLYYINCELVRVSVGSLIILSINRTDVHVIASQYF